MEYKVRWKRSEKVDRLSSIGSPNDRRPFYAMVKDEWVGNIYNSSAHFSTSDDKREWYVSFFGAPKNINLAKRFAFENIDDAKKFFVDMLNAIMNSAKENEKLFDMRSRIIARGLIKVEEK